MKIMKVAKLLAAATAFGYVCIGIAAYALAADVTASGGRNADGENQLTFAAGIGNYGSETACSLGMFYWPTESVMMSLGGTYGNDENMLNVGVSFALDRRAEIEKEMSATEKELAEMREELARLTAIVDELTKQKEQA